MESTLIKPVFLVTVFLVARAGIAAFAQEAATSGGIGVRPPTPPPPQPTIEAVLAENELLRAQLREMQMSYQLLCSDPAIIEAKFATVQAKKKQAETAKPAK